MEIPFDIYTIYFDDKKKIAFVICNGNKFWLDVEQLSRITYLLNCYFIENKKTCIPIRIGYKFYDGPLHQCIQNYHDNILLGINKVIIPGFNKKMYGVSIISNMDK